MIASVFARMGKQSLIRRAFTLVELLVVIAIIGVLIALLLPAVQAAREAARRMQCSNNLKQWGLGLHTHHDAHKEFPNTLYQRTGGCSTANNGRQRLSFVYPLLPYIEQNAIYDKIKNDVDNGVNCQWIWYGGANTPSVLPISIAACPSDSEALVPSGQLQRGNYRLNRGDIVCGSEDNSVRSPFRRGDQGQSGFSTATDGTSNTIAFAEATVAIDNGPYPKFKRGVAELGIDGEGATAASLCLAKKRADGSLDSDKTVLEAHRLPGRRLYEGRMSVMGVNFILPPNSPYCGSATTPDGGAGFLGPASFHTGGVNVAMIDGSVHFVSDTIDSGDPAQDVRAKTGISTGNIWASSFSSIYGVWGAAATPASGESKQLP
jgi:prepilin-type N-terminal cleavage/methylation domain-containing protein/prepilin-type processing-associated H-X9-DG protein